MLRPVARLRSSCKPASSRFSLATFALRVAARCLRPILPSWSELPGDSWLVGHGCLRPPRSTHAELRAADADGENTRLSVRGRLQSAALWRWPRCGCRTVSNYEPFRAV